jgi:hypothetical protein
MRITVVTLSAVDHGLVKDDIKTSVAHGGGHIVNKNYPSFIAAFKGLIEQKEIKGQLFETCRNWEKT